MIPFYHIRGDNGVTVTWDNREKITVSFPYNLRFVQKIKTIPGHRWHPEEKHWSFPNNDGTLKKILKVFEGEDMHIDPALQLQLHKPVIARSEATKQSQGTVPDLPRPCSSERGLRTEQSGVVGVPAVAGRGLSPMRDFEALRRELLSRKYSYKTVNPVRELSQMGYSCYEIRLSNLSVIFLLTISSIIFSNGVKGYIYYNRDFLNFAGKNPSDINGNNIKDYLLYPALFKSARIYLAEEKQSATSAQRQQRFTPPLYIPLLLTAGYTAGFIPM